MWLQGLARTKISSQNIFMMIIARSELFQKITKTWQLYIQQETEFFYFLEKISAIFEPTNINEAKSFIIERGAGGRS